MLLLFTAMFLCGYIKLSGVAFLPPGAILNSKETFLDQIMVS